MILQIKLRREGHVFYLVEVELGESCHVLLQIEFGYSKRVLADKNLLSEHWPDREPTSHKWISREDAAVGI